MTSNLPVFLTQPVTTGAEEWRVPFDPNTPSLNLDHFIQLSTDHTTRSYVVRSIDSDSFMSAMFTWACDRVGEIDLLKSFAAWQKRKLDYDGLYTAYLLEALSEEEFVSEAHSFATVLEQPDEQRILDVAERLAALLPFEVTTADLAEFLKTEPRLVLEAIASSDKPKLRALLPEHILKADDRKYLNHEQTGE
ncbi:hypothetical protein [Burkholderia sp. BCC1999]|uniref:hypothetical protein n=1 Tax=Burkholderia sp. BCC1999 TaxID=2817448 RepID=UPI002AC3644D|nr:hypothetical protein [Burkholderia sp. BCC1999]